MNISLANAHTNFTGRAAQLNLLEGIAKEVNKSTAKDKGKKRNILRNIELVFIITLFETFIEELLEQAVEHICSECPDPAKLPGNVIAKICTSLSERKDVRAIWEIAGDKWKIEYRRYCKEKLSSFNTPRHTNINKLVEECLGLKHCTNSWRWQRMSPDKATQIINCKITVRGEIVHQLNRQTNLSVASLKKFHSHLMRCMAILSNQIRNHVNTITGQYPWGGVKY